MDKGLGEHSTSLSKSPSKPHMLKNQVVKPKVEEKKVVKRKSHEKSNLLQESPPMQKSVSNKERASDMTRTQGTEENDFNNLNTMDQFANFLIQKSASVTFSQLEEDVQQPGTY
jgi:hypothetical protein